MFIILYFLNCFVIRYFYLKNKEQVSFKRRKNFYSSFSNLKFGNFGIYALKSFRFEFNSLIFLKKITKILSKTKYLLKNFFSFWFYLIANFPLTKKSKNSRMGKGKGDFLRWVIKVPSNLIFLEFKILKLFNYFFFFKKFLIFFGPTLKILEKK